MNNLEPNIYSSIVTTRNAHRGLNWNRAQMLLVLHTIALPITLNPSTENTMIFVISCVALFVTIILFTAIIRGTSWLKFYDAKLAEMELLADQGGGAGTRIRVYSDPRFKTLSDKRTVSVRLFEFASMAMIVFWAEEIIRHARVLAPYLAYLRIL